MRSAISAVLVLACALPASAADAPAGVIRVTATYPGADARTIDETVIIPLFMRINGAEGITRIESEARNDGTGTVTAYFEPKADLNLAQVAVQNRVSLALPAIPAPCRKLGIPVRKFPAGPPTFWLALTSADAGHDAEFLGDYATIFLKDALARIPGVADVRVVGAGEFGVRVWLKPDRLCAYKMATGDVVDALRRQNTGAAAGGRGFPFTASGRMTHVEQFGHAVLRTTPNGEVLRVRDVARVELGSEANGFARVNGKPAALIAVTAWPGRVTADQLRNVEGADDLPPGAQFDVVADRSADRLLEVEVRLPDLTSREQTEKVIGRVTDLIRGQRGKPDTVVLAEGRASNTATILVKVPAKGGPTAADLEQALAVIPDATIRVGGVTPGRETFPVRLALTDRAEQDEDLFRELTDSVVKRLTKDAGITGVAAFPGPPVRQLAIDIDRDRSAMAGVEMDDIFTALQAAGDGVHATDFTRFGRRWRVTVQNDPPFAREAKDLNYLHVRSASGEIVFLAKVLKTRKVLAPLTVVRVNGYRAVVITANPPAGQTPAETAALCVKLAREVLPRGYSVKDLTEPPQ